MLFVSITFTRNQAFFGFIFFFWIFCTYLLKFKLPLYLLLVYTLRYELKVQNPKRMDLASIGFNLDSWLLLAFWHIQYYIIQYFAIVLNVNIYEIINNRNIIYLLQNGFLEVNFLFLILTGRLFGILNSCV